MKTNHPHPMVRFIQSVKKHGENNYWDNVQKLSKVKLDKQ